MNESSEMIASAEQSPSQHKANGEFAAGNTIGKQWKPGESGNPAGRPKNVGRSIVERMNDMAGFNTDQLFEIAEDKKAPITDVAAARRLLAMSGELDETKLSPREERESVTMAIDYTDGRPAQTVLVKQEDMRSPVERARELLCEMRRMVGMEEPDELPDNTSGHDVVVVEGVEVEG